MNKQILEVVDSVSMEKGVDKEIIFEALEEAISSATKKLTEDEANISVEINRDTGGYKTFRNWMIVAEEDLVDQIFEITEKDITDHVVEEGIATREIENIDFGRISAQAAKQVILSLIHI